MTKDDIIKMAREAGLMVSVIGCTAESCRRFADCIAAAEREACAQLAAQTVCDTHLPTGIKIYGTAAAKAIRSRSNK